MVSFFNSGLNSTTVAVAKCLKNLLNLALVVLTCCGVFAVLGLQMYKDINCTIPLADRYETRSKFQGNQTCNSSTGQEYLYYENFSSAFLTTLRTISHDTWEAIFQTTIQATGQFSLIFFFLISYVVPYTLVSLVVAIVAKTTDKVFQEAEDVELATIEEAGSIRITENPLAVETNDLANDGTDTESVQNLDRPVISESIEMQEVTISVTTTDLVLAEVLVVNEDMRNNNWAISALFSKFQNVRILSFKLAHVVC